MVPGRSLGVAGPPTALASIPRVLIMCLRDPWTPVDLLKVCDRSNKEQLRSSYRAIRMTWYGGMAPPKLLAEAKRNRISRWLRIPDLTRLGPMAHRIAACKDAWNPMWMHATSSNPLGHNAQHVQIFVRKLAFWLLWDLELILAFEDSLESCRYIAWSLEMGFLCTIGPLESVLLGMIFPLSQNVQRVVPRYCTCTF